MAGWSDVPTDYVHFSIHQSYITFHPPIIHHVSSTNHTPRLIHQSYTTSHPPIIHHVSSTNHTPRLIHQSYTTFHPPIIHHVISIHSITYSGSASQVFRNDQRSGSQSGLQPLHSQRPPQPQPGACGRLWLLVAVCGFLWLSVIFVVFVMFLAVCECLWMFLDVFGCLWQFVDVCECLWMFVVFALFLVSTVRPHNRLLYLFENFFVKIAHKWWFCLPKQVLRTYVSCYCTCGPFKGDSNDKVGWGREVVGMSRWVDG